MTKSFNDKIIERGGINRKGRKEEFLGVTQRSSLQVKNANNLEG